MSRNSEFRADRRSVAFSYPRYAVKRPHMDGLVIVLACVICDCAQSVVLAQAHKKHRDEALQEQPT